MITKQLFRSADQQITVVFRYDDYSSRADSDSDFSQSAFQKLGVPCTVGVVPCITPVDESTEAQQEMPLTPEKMLGLRTAVQLGLAHVALHGYSHKTMLSRADGGWTEFVGLSCESQVERITKGKHLLESLLGFPINTFIPPWNSYDSNTLRALEHLGFECISAGKYGPVIESTHLCFLPYTCGLFDLSHAIAECRSSAARNRVIVALFHPTDLGREQCNSQYLMQLLLWVKSQEDVRIQTIQQAVAEQKGLNASQYKAYYRSPTRRLLRRLVRQHALLYSL